MSIGLAFPGKLLIFILVNFISAEKKNDRISVPVAGGSNPITSTVSLETLVLQSFENWRSVMLKGNAANHIPFLDPFVVPFDILLKFPNPLSSNLGYYEILLNKLTFSGLSTFKVKALEIHPLNRDMSFNNYIGNMSASTNYSLKYYISKYLPVPAPIGEGSAYGAIYGADLRGTGTLLPTPGNWFQLSKISMTFSFESLDIRIYPKLPIGDPALQKSIQDSIYNEIQRLKPNMSDLSTMTYSKTVEFKLN